MKELAEIILDQIEQQNLSFSEFKRELEAARARKLGFHFEGPVLPHIDGYKHFFEKRIITPYDYPYVDDIFYLLAKDKLPDNFKDKTLRYCSTIEYRFVICVDRSESKRYCLLADITENKFIDILYSFSVHDGSYYSQDSRDDGFHKRLREKKLI